MYYNNFVFKIIAKIFLFPLLLRNLKVIRALNDLKLGFITKSVKEIQSLRKRLKPIQHFKSKIGPCEVLFLQETHSSSTVEQKWKEDFHGKVFFPHGKTNSRGVLIVYFGTGKFTLKKQQTDHSSRILILDVAINDSEYI